MTSRKDLSWLEEDVDPWMKKIRTVNRWKKALKTLALVAIAVALIWLAVGNSSAHAETTTQLIPENSLVFLQLKSLRANGENEVLCLYLESGAVYTAASADRILQTVDLDEVDDQTTLPAYDKFKRQSKVLDLDKFVKKVDRGTVVLQKVEAAGQYLWDLSEDLNSWLDGKYEKWGVYDKLEDWGVSNFIRKLFGQD